MKKTPVSFVCWTWLGVVKVNEAMESHNKQPCLSQTMAALLR